MNPEREELIAKLEEFIHCPAVVEAVRTIKRDAGIIEELESELLDAKQSREVAYDMGRQSMEKP